MLDQVTLIGANNPANDTDFDAWTKTNRAIASANAGQLQGFKNRLINGAMAIDQRGTAGVAVGTGAFVFGPDRWAAIAAGAAVSMFRVATSPALAGFRWQLQFNGAASNTNVTARQRIEADNSADLAGRTVAVSFNVFHTTGAARQVSVAIARANAVDNFTGVTAEGSGLTAAVASGVWTKVVVPIALSAAATTGLEVTFSSNGAVLAGQVFCITGGQLEPGVEDTAFEVRPVSLELALCQRYYARVGTSGQGPIDNRGMAQCTSATTALALFCSPAPLRATPTAGDVSAPATWQLLTAAGGLSTVTGAAVNTYSPTGVQIVFTGAAGLTAGHATQPYGAVAQTTFVGISAEL